MVRPDFALQLLLRTKRKDNPHQNPEYQALAHAISELKRLYRIEQAAQELAGVGLATGSIEELKLALQEKPTYP